MFMSTFKNWLDSVDPYAIQQVALYKALFVATIMVYVYWFFLPSDFLGFISPCFLIFFHENPTLSSFKKKAQYLLFTLICLLFISISFVLLYPFKMFFFFFSLLTLTVLYFVILNHFPDFKNLTMPILCIATIVLSSHPPPANFQVVYGHTSAIILSMFTLFVCLSIFPNQYLKIWSNALQKYIAHLECNIDDALQKNEGKPTREEIIHFEMVRNYQCLVGKRNLLPAFRIATYIRNIHLSLDSLYYEEKNEQFWLQIKQQLIAFRHCMKESIRYTPTPIAFVPQTYFQHYVLTYLHRSFFHWNKLCTK